MIGNSINELISIAERQSDERLAQELNPQTETGMLGPAWLPASELAFRQKIRAEAQAQPQTNPPVVQQLAQASMPPMMPQQPMAQQGMPQQMPPQQMMPQQPMPPQMMAHGGMVDGATQSEKDALLSIWDKMTPEQKEQMMNKSSESDRERKFWDAYEADPDSFAKDAQYYDILQKDRQSAGDLIGYANGGHVNVGQRLGPLMSPDDLLRRTFPQLYPVPVSPDQQIVDSAIDQLMANQPNIADQANKNAQENEMLRNRLARMEEESEQYNQSSPATISPPLTVMGKDQVGGGISGIDPDDIPNAGNLDIDAEGNIIEEKGILARINKELGKVADTLPSSTGMGPYSGSYAQVDPISNEELLEGATDAPYAEDITPLGRDIRRKFREIAGYGTIEETEKEILARQIEKEQGKNLDQIQSSGDTTGYLFQEGLSDEDLERYSKAEEFYEGLMGEGRPTGFSPLQRIGESDSKTISRYFANNPDQYAELQALQKEHGEQEGLLLFAEQNMKSDDKEPTEAQVLEEIQVTAQKRGPLVDQDGGPPKGTIINKTTDGTDVTAKASTVQSSTTGRALQDDALLAEQQRLDELKEQIFKGNMDRKWMAIAAGAFNAAQKGAPTLMQGLADLGGGVTQELQKMDKEDQDRAMALYEIYLQEATLAESKRKTDLTYEAAMYGHSIDSLKDIADRVGKNAKDVLDATKAFNTAQKNKTLGDFGTEQYVGALIDYADMGVTSAALEYNQEVGKLNAKEKEILSDIEDFDPNNPDHIKEAREEMTEYLNDNPSMKLLYNDYWSKRATQDEKGKTIPFDISSSLIIRPPTG